MPSPPPPVLLRAGLSRDEYVGTANVVSAMVDVTRLLVYVIGLTWLAQQRDYEALGDIRTLWLVAAACLAGFLGSYFGAKAVKTVTLRAIRNLVAALLFPVAAALGAGLV